MQQREHSGKMSFSVSMTWLSYFRIVSVSCERSLISTFFQRGLKALGVRDLNYRLAFLACSVTSTSPRVRTYVISLNSWNCIVVNWYLF